MNVSPQKSSLHPPYDIAIIGGGINGSGIARDAAGRGHRVFLCEKRDFASGTSSASTKLIHGGLRYLEYYEFRLVREALREREVLWGIAPHIAWPLRFVLPHHTALRPRWLLRLGLFLYDNIGGRKRLPATRSVDLRTDKTGRPLKPEFTRGFEYSDCWVEDSRLTVLNAAAAASLGATVRSRTACVSATRQDGLWHITTRSEDTGEEDTILARALVNAAGPWVDSVVHQVVRENKRAPVRLVQGSHIVVPRLYDHDECYIFQNADKRIFFVIPYETDYTLIGTTDRDYDGDPADVRATPEEIDYLCRSASDYLRQPVTPEMVVWTYSGVRPLYADDEQGKEGSASAATRDYVLKLEQEPGQAPLLNIFGGKITTYRRLAESVLAKIEPLLPAPQNGRRAGWTATVPLPGGDFARDGYERLVADLAARYPFASQRLLRRLVRHYGTRASVVLGDAQSMADLGREHGADLTDAELRYLVRHEWARTGEDVLWRRTKQGLRLTAEQRAAVDEAVRAIAAEEMAATVR
ncbi:glycerol-3-phosphate dehydrogenase [Acetobacteraceae bacterium KSS8]|uniref:Glycerol-3-phosphate dehydrogenase n=1 Tax=Endosaccharibacter trunci TaxID=2812733 RepID=A0ABT1W5S9_9PROT|nr:glycerol-3-phosphate dehydrogenase [Acetobacteraceae bacterium KSS8]